MSVREFLAFLAFGKRPSGFANSGSGIVIHLGGNLWCSVLLSRRLRYPLVVYTDRTILGAKTVSAFLVEDERIQASLIAKGVPRRARQTYRKPHGGRRSRRNGP